MTLLLDVNVLVAAIWSFHTNHVVVNKWLAGKALATCPISELGFLRISTNPKAINAPMADARYLLERFLAAHGVSFLPADLPALKSAATTSEAVTDNYLADFAVSHGCALATLDKGIKHRGAVLIA